RETPYGPIPEPVHDAPDLPPEAFTACPGKGLNYPDLNDFVFGRQPENRLVGHYRRAWIGYSAVPEVRRQGASGGVITQTLIYLLRAGLIDGAVTVRQGQPKPWQAEAVIARTEADLRAASQSVYQPVPVNTILQQAAEFDGRLAYVGLPDQVAAIRRLQQLGNPAAQKIVYTLGPYTGTNMYFEAIKSYLRSNGVHHIHDITRLRYREGEWPGYLSIRTRSGKEFQAAKFYYNYLIPFYITRSTLYSVDFTNELTDFSVGDAWSPRYEALRQGYSVVVARTERGEQVLSDMQAQGLVELDPVDMNEVLAMHGHMIDFKKRGAFIRMDWRRASGQPVPDYGYRPREIPLSRRLVEVVISGLFRVCSTTLARRIVERLPIRLIGPLFDTARKTWKDASKPVKRAGLRQIQFDTWHENALKLAHTDSLVTRIAAEIRHWLRPHWSLEAVGVHWGRTEDYDDINAETYSYFRRFVDGLNMSDWPAGAHVLDICARTGNGTLYFYQQGRVGSAMCADVSENMGEICRQRLRAGGFENFEWVKFDTYRLPFEDHTFDAVLCFETVEHLSLPELLVHELARVTKPGGTLILTTPNVLWEPVHALAAITGAHHSEGPHRFIRYGRLQRMVREAGYRIDKQATTVLIPGGPKSLVRLGEWIEARTPHTLMPLLGLRRILICRKP
ncbi:MAG: Coenzyme F420 hydrogenase/dehydrogenase, beta subunit C-terminal domain, partial [Anaerolineae bacterium]|nr:Coenzyme F420 hydrogenase/dehydrogenase, beta subunit C-terminal domain [Anaerolineae bacterium]